MKKALALILTAAMLLSCCVIGASAERVWSVEEKVVFEDTVTYSVSNGIYGSSDPFFSGDYILTMTIKGSVAEFGQEFETVGYIKGSPEIKATDDTISFNGAPSKVSYDFADETWYKVQYVVEDDTTTVKVNDEVVGTIDAYMPAMVYGTMYRCWIGECVMTDLDGNFKWGDDFEDEVDDLFGGTIETIKEVEKIYTNENVEVAKDTVTYSGSNGIYSVENALFDGDYILTVKIKGNAESEGKAFETVGFLEGSPVINVDAGTISFNGAPSTLNYDFADNTWYTVQYKVVGDTTTVFVNGEEVGSIAKYMRPLVYGTMYRCWISEFVYTDLDGNFKWGDDFEDGTDDLFGGVIEEVYVEGDRYDLGNYYWSFNYMDGYGHYLHPDVNLTGKDVAFDFQFNSLTATDGNVNSAANWGNMFVLDLQAGKVGVNSGMLDYSFKADTWYHVEFINDGDSTAIYVDGALVGTVNAVFDERWGGGLHGIDIDNLQIGDYFEDFEDQDFANKSDTAGAAVAYEFVEPPVVDPYTVLDNGAAEGDAKMFTTNKADGGTSYFYNPGDYPDVKSSKTVYAFDLALVANDANGLAEAGKTWFGIWRDTGGKRFKVGFDVNNTQLTGFAGEGDAVVGFDWGEFTATNFHDVIMIFKGTKATIYIDGVKLYEGASGTPGINGSGATLFEVVNGTAIIDNFAVYAPDTCELLYEGFGELSSNGNFDKAYDWTIGGDCDANQCIYGHTERTSEPTCYSEGVDTRYCAICGEAMKEDSVAMVDHKYANYDINRTENGLIYTHCRNNGCVEKRFVTPTDEAYTGTIYAYFDMQDDFMSVLDAKSESEPYWGHVFVYENGVATADARNYPGSYSKFSLDNALAAKVDGKDWSLNFDFTYNGTWDTDDNINSGYEHYLTFMLCGKNSVWLIFNMDKMTITVTGNKHAGYNLVEEDCKYNFVEGGTYNVQISYWQHEIIDPDDPEGWMDDDGKMQYNYVLDCGLYVTINNETVIAYDYANMGYDCQSIAFSDSDSLFRTTYQQNFGVDYSIDNFVIGTHDFAWTERCYEGDVNGDNYLDSLDAVAMRQYLAKVIDGSTLEHTRWDINADGEINAKDQLALRKMLAA